MHTKGVIYIVATPIGNLGDITQRAIQTLKEADLIAAEDTRHSHHLLNLLGIKKPLISLHEHNEAEKTQELLEKVQEGIHLALISDAGTPLINDPGYFLVNKAHELGIKVVPVPGPSALITALCASGLPTNRFAFEGFLPSKSQQRRQTLLTLKEEERTLIFYEAPHRILETLEDMIEIFGEKREASFARELTKVYETIKMGSLQELLKWIKMSENEQRGEIVLMVKGLEKNKNIYKDKSEEEVKIIEILEDPETIRLIKILLKEVSVKQAASIAADILKEKGIKKRDLYDLAVKISKGI